MTTVKQQAGNLAPSARAAGGRASFLRELLGAFSPNRVISKSALRFIIVFQIAVLLLVWATSTYVFLPKPMDVWRAFVDLWNHEGLGQELIVSFLLNVQAMAWATVISLGLAYLTVVPVFQPIAHAVSKGRFLGMVGLTFFFTIIFASGHRLKVSLLVFGVAVFFVTSMIDVVAQVPKEKFDLARTLRMGEWRVVWEVIVLGQIDKGFDVLRQNAAIGWMMLTMVEGVVRSEGGVGTILLDQNHHFRLAAVFAIQLTILALGLLQDYGIGLMKSLLCPYAALTLERK